MKQNIALFVGILIAELLAQYPRMKDSKGYFWPALWRSSGFMLIALAARWILAWVLLELSKFSGLKLSDTWEWATVMGLVAVSLPTSIEAFIDKKASVSLIQKPLIKLLRKYNMFTGQLLRRESQRLKQRDNYDCQNCRIPWQFGLTTQQVNRRLRVLYEFHKLQIANARKEPELLRHDIEIPSGQKFYLLVAHIGRRALRRVLQENGPTTLPDSNWSGEERRRRIGSKPDRKPSDPNPLRFRIHDNEELRKKILNGKAFLE